ncbi:MAG: hypothetical protein AAF628_16445 [Planctomycetota bacterium]
MTVPMLSSAAALVVALIAPLLPAQAHHVVPDDFPDIQAAVDAAAPGDIVLVRFGVTPWPSFQVDKSLSIIGWNASYTAITTIGLTDPERPVLIDLEPGERVDLIGLEFIEASSSSGGVDGVVVRGGVVMMEDCRIKAGSLATPGVIQVALRAELTDLHLLRTWVESNSGGIAVWATNAKIHAASSRLFGGFAAPMGTMLQLSELRASGCIMLGGDTGVGTGGIGLFADAGSRAWLSGTSITGGFGSVGGAGIVNAGAAPIELARSGVEGGLGFSPGPASIGPVTFNAKLLGVHAGRRLAQVGTLRLGQWLTASFDGDAGEPLLLLAGVDLAQLPGTGLLAHSLDVAPPWLSVGAGVLDSVGSFAFGTVLPNDPALYDQSVWLQGISGVAAPFAVSPVVGGVIRR